MFGIIAVILGIVLVFCLLWAMVMAQARLLKQCMNLSIVLGIVFLLVPGVNIIGLILLAISGAMLLSGKCKKCDDKNKTSS